jgi:outer membrane protein assembly factor BamB
MAFADGTVCVPVVNFRATGTGEVNAIDAATRSLVWKAEFKSPAFGGATVAGDLVFTSTLAGTLVAFDRASGAMRWSWQAPGA